MNTSDRRTCLYRFIKALVESDYGPSHPNDLLFCSSSKSWETTHPHVIFGENDYPSVMTGTGALDYIESGHSRLTLFWGDPAAGTGDLVLVDIDEPYLAENLPDTLTISSGTDGHTHRIYHNVDGSVRNSWPTGKSKVNADPNGDRSSWTMVPGAVHESGEVYQMVDRSQPIADLTPGDLPGELRA